MDIFRDIINMLEGRAPSAAPTTEMLIEVALRQLRYAVEDKGEVVAIPESRKQIALYLKGFRGAARIRTEINTSLTLSGVEAVPTARGGMSVNKKRKKWEKL